eukprot:15450852-Alexandrium_andersonii.AAC.1
MAARRPEQSRHRRRAQLAATPQPAAHGLAAKGDRPSTSANGLRKTGGGLSGNRMTDEPALVCG